MLSLFKLCSRFTAKSLLRNKEKTIAGAFHPRPPDIMKFISQIFINNLKSIAIFLKNYKLKTATCREIEPSILLISEGLIGAASILTHTSLSFNTTGGISITLPQNIKRQKFDYSLNEQIDSARSRWLGIGPRDGVGSTVLVVHHGHGRR